MSHVVCQNIGSWVESHVNQQVEHCVEQDCNWWCACCNKWLCGLVWVLVNVTTWVVQTVCETVADFVDLGVNLVLGAWDVLAGIFTGDWSRFLAGLGEIGGGGLAFLLQMLSIVTFGTLIGTFLNSSNAWKLRNYARAKLQEKYGTTDPDSFDKMVQALGLDSGGFGLRLKVTAPRLYVRSDFSSQRDGTPDLFMWSQPTNNPLDPPLDLKKLAGFNPPLWWNRTWPELVGDAGDIADYDIDTYLINKGVGDQVRHFSIFCMSRDAMQTRLECAEQHASEIGLVLQTNIVDTQALTKEQIIINTDIRFDPLNNIIVDHVANALEAAPLRRSAGQTNTMARDEICQPLCAGCFGFTDTKRGVSKHLFDCTCLEPDAKGSFTFAGENLTGVFFENCKPDLFFKYTAIHELGHTFGLCHVDGMLRIMWTPAPDQKKSWVTWPLIWHLFTSGTEARFILDEGKKVWDYIVANAAQADLETRQF